MKTEYVRTAITMTKNFDEWLRKLPQFKKKKFSSSIEHTLKIALYYDQRIDEKKLKDTLELLELKRIADNANAEFEEKQRYMRWKQLYEEKQKTELIKDVK